MTIGKEDEMLTFDQAVADACFARTSCKQHQKLCSTACSWFIELRYQVSLSGIPKRHAKWTVDTLPDDMVHRKLLERWAEIDVERVTGGQGLYLYGSVGVGKTTAATALALTYIVHKTKLAMQTGERTTQLVQFVNVPDLLASIKQGFDDKEAATDAAATVEKLRTVPLVVFDDIGAERPSEWVRERLLTIIGHRYDNELSTFFTSNMTLPELAEPLGSRIKSRIEGMTVPLHFQGADRRRKL